MKRLLTLLMIGCAVLTMSAQPPKPLPSLHVEGKWLVDTHGNHVVLHGVMDTPSAWFNGGRWGWSYDDAGRKRCLDYFEKMFTALEIANCDIFRLHLEPAWTNDNSYTYAVANGQQPEGTSGEADISHFNPARLRSYLPTLYFPLMKKAMKHGMYVVVRPPGVCPGTIQVGGYYQKYLTEVWDIVTQNDSIRRYAGQIMIELANEPVGLRNAAGTSSDSDQKALHDFFQPIVDKIRSNGFTGIVLAPGTGYQSNYRGYKNYPIEGYNIGYAVHDYPGWYNCSDDKVDNDRNINKSIQDNINAFKDQVPVVETNPVIITEVDWSPLKEPREVDHYNEFGQPTYKNLGTWATASTSKWGRCFKALLEKFPNISMTLTHPHDYIDLDKMMEDPTHPVPAFGGNKEACSGACFEWYAEYIKVDQPLPDFASVPVSDQGAKYENPIVRADFPDPDVIRVGDTYYMVSTTMSLFPGATILKSQDMVNWEYCANPLQKLSDEMDGYSLKKEASAYSCGMWACSMKYNDGKFYILINERRPVPEWILQGWLLTTSSPEGTWTAKKLPRSYYDPGMLFDGDKVYVAQGVGNISVCELDKNFNFKREVTIVSGRDGLEGSHMYKRKGSDGKDYYYIYATYGGWPSGQAIFRATDPMGPYEERMLVEKIINGKPNTIHQGALIEDVKGNWWTIMQQDLGALGRFPNLQPVKWGTDNWPVVGNNGVPYDSYTKPAATGDISLKRLPTTDNFRSYPLGMQWEWNHSPDNDGWSLFERQGWLRLKTTSTSATLPWSRNILTQRIFMKKDKVTTGTVRLDVSRLQEGDRAGICILQDPFGAIAVEVKGGKHQLVWWQDKVKDAGSSFTPSEKTQDVELTDNIVYLRAAIKYGDDKAMFYYSTDNKTWKRLGSDTKQSFNLSVFFGARFGLFCYSTKSAGGVADFDWFSTEADFDEETIYPAFTPTLDEKMFTVTKIAAAKSQLEAMIGGFSSPGITATFKDNHKENVTTQTNFEAETPGIVEFRSGQMVGLDQGETNVTATYTDLFGNKAETSFRAASSYFPLDPQYVSANLAGSGTYTRGSAAGVMKFLSADSQMGWVFTNKMDLTGFKYLVINLYNNQTAKASVNFYITTSIKGACASVPLNTTGKQTVIDLQSLTYTSGNNKGRALNLKSINMVTFKGDSGKSVNLTGLLLTNDTKYDPTGIIDVAWQQADSQPVNVYTASGRLVRRAVSRSEALKGLPAGLYIVGGRKIVIPF